MKKLKIFIIILLCLMLIPFIINFYVVFKVKNKIVNIDEINKNYDYGLVLGCGVKSDGTPSLMLRDRLDKVIEIYNKGLINNICDVVLPGGVLNINYSDNNHIYMQGDAKRVFKGIYES